MQGYSTIKVWICVGYGVLGERWENGKVLSQLVGIWGQELAVEGRFDVEAATLEVC